MSIKAKYKISRFFSYFSFLLIFLGCFFSFKNGNNYIFLLVSVFSLVVLSSLLTEINKNKKDAEKLINGYKIEKNVDLLMTKDKKYFSGILKGDPIKTVKDTNCIVRKQTIIPMSFNQVIPLEFIESDNLKIEIGNKIFTVSNPEKINGQINYFGALNLRKNEDQEIAKKFNLFPIGKISKYTAKEEIIENYSPVIINGLPGYDEDGNIISIEADEIILNSENENKNRFDRLNIKFNLFLYSNLAIFFFILIFFMNLI